MEVDFSVFLLFASLVTILILIVIKLIMSKQLYTYELSYKPNTESLKRKSQKMKRKTFSQSRQLN